MTDEQHQRMWEVLMAERTGWTLDYIRSLSIRDRNSFAAVTHAREELTLDKDKS